MKKITATLILAIFHFFAFAQYTQGESVLIEYQGNWYKGKIIEVKTPNFLVGYDDYDASWNETVASERLKRAETNTALQNTSVSSVNKEGIAQNCATEMCDCLTKMMKTQKQEDKSKCLMLQEAHVTKLIKGSQSYIDYKKQVSECEKQLTPIKNQAEKQGATFEGKLKQVCDCFNDSKSGKKEKFECFKLQDDLSKQVESRKAEFIRETNKCDN